jgi:hypothetical protein
VFVAGWALKEYIIFDETVRGGEPETVDHCGLLANDVAERLSTLRAGAQGANVVEPTNAATRSRHALVCSFDLPPGTYATMLFRELQKTGHTPRLRAPHHLRFDSSEDELLDDTHTSVPKITKKQRRLRKK